MMSLLEPEVIKLDLALVQGSPDADIAELVTAVAAQAERSGARILSSASRPRGTPHLRRAGRPSPRAGSRPPRTEIVPAESPGEPVVAGPSHADPRDLAPFAIVASCAAPRAPATRRCCWR